MLYTIITRFNNYFDRVGQQTTLWEALCTDLYRLQVERIREMADKEDRDRAKAMLPCYFISCVSKNREAGIHTGLICIEWDQGVTDWLHFLAWLRQFDFILFAGLSVSGRGVYAVIPIKYPEAHQAHFQALYELFEKANVPIDPSGKNVNRLRGVSDNTPETSFINPNAVRYTGLVYAKPAKQAANSTGKDAIKVQAYVDRIVAEQLNVTEGYDNWVRIGLALASEFGESGREWFHKVSSTHADYKAEVTDRKYSSLLKNSGKVRLGTFYRICDSLSLSKHK